MNIQPDVLIAGSGFVVSVCGFIITAGIMLKSNKRGFDSINESHKKGLEMVDLKIGNLIQVLALERDSMKKDIRSLEDDCENIKGQFKDQIYPRLNKAEQDIQKNCRAVIDHKELCNERHRKGA